MFGSLLLALPLATQGAATALQMAQAMDIPTNTIVSATFTQLANAEAANLAVDWGTRPPQKGTNLAVLSTGKALDANSPGYVAPSPGTIFSTSHPNPVAGQTTCGGTEGVTAYDYSELTITLKAPSNAVAFSLKFNFYTVEYPE